MYINEANATHMIDSMDLYHLHRSSPAQQQAPAAQPQSTTDSALLQALMLAQSSGKTPNPEQARSELEQAQRHAAHWQKETVKMDRIARDALDKLEAKREARRALKAELAASIKDAETWRTRYRELSDVLQKGKHADPRLEQAERRLREIEQERPEVQQKLMRLEQAERRLREIEQERPEVQQKLLIGGQAFRELQALKIAKAASDNAVAELRVQLAKPAGRVRELELEVVAGKEKLRAAAQEASAQSARFQACTDMLARAEQVLKTCSSLQATKGTEASTALAEALTETTTNVAQFLQSVAAGKPGH